MFDILKRDLDIAFDEKTQNDILKYIDYFKSYNSHTNLMSKNDEKVLFEKHIFDSLAINLFFKKYNIPNSIMDIGTGGGFPSVPLSFAFKNVKISAVDSTSKKIKFIDEVKNEFNLKNLVPIVSRIEDLPKNMKESEDVVVSRALGSLQMLLEYAAPYLKVGGYFVAYKSQDSENELSAAKNAIKILNVELVDEIGYKLPLEENFDRKLLIFKKLKPTSSIYPRENKLMKNSPL